MLYDRNDVRSIERAVDAWIYEKIEDDEETEESSPTEVVRLSGIRSRRF